MDKSTMEGHRSNVLIRNWQQTLVDYRGGVDDLNLEDMIADSVRSHEHTNPNTKSYRSARTVRAAILGGVVFEALGQEALMLQGENGLVPMNPGTRITPDVDIVLNQMPDAFANLALSFTGAYQARLEADADMAFYTHALDGINDWYWSSRIESIPFRTDEPCDVDRLKREWHETPDFDSGFLSLVADNVAGCADLSVALGMSLCRAKQRVCTTDELSDFFRKSLVTANDLASVSRRRLLHPPIALPYHFGYRVLSGDEEMLHSKYLVAVPDNRGGYKALWNIRSLRNGGYPHASHCPGSNYNPLQLRTEAEQQAIQANLGSFNLKGLVETRAIPSGQIMLARSLTAAQATTYQETDWQERVLAAG
jgi:hypothetical protein